MAEEGGKVSLDVVPNFTSFGSLFSGGIRGALQTAEREGGRIGGLLGGGLKTGVTLGVAAAGVAIGEFVSSGMQKYLQLTAQTRLLQRVTQESAGDTSLFAGVIRKLGGDVEATTKPLGILGANIAKHPELFQKYGVAVARFKDGNVDLLGTLDNVRRKTLETTSADERLALQKDLLGKGYQTLLPYLNLTNQSLEIYQRLARQGGEVLTQKDEDLAREYKIRLTELTDEVERYKVAAGRKGTELATGFLGGLDVLSKVTLKDFLTNFDPTAPARREVEAEQGVKRAMAESKIATQDKADADARLATAEDKVSTAAAGVRSAEQAQASAHEATARAVQAAAKAAEGVEKAKEGQVRAHEATQRAVEQEAQAEKSLSDLLAKGPVDAKAVESARQGLESADRSVASATESLAQAEQNLVQIQQFEAVDAANELSAAHLQLSQTTLQLAQARLQASRAVPTLSDPFAQRQAQLQVRQATLAQSQARENLDKIQQFGTQADKAAADAQKQVRDGAQRVTDALDAQADAQAKLNEALAGDPQFEQKVADAKRQVRDASLAVRDANQGERDAALAVRDANQSVVDANQSVVDARKNEEEAALRVRDAQYKLDEAVKNAGVDQQTLIDDLKQRYPELAGIVEQSYDRMARAAEDAAARQRTAFDALKQQVQAKVDATPVGERSGPGFTYGTLPPGSVYNPDTGGVTLPQPRAGGGGVIPGKTYLINEKARETVTFDAPGTVHPANLTPVGDDGGSMPIDYNLLGNAVASALASALDGMGIFVDRQKFGELASRATASYRSAISGRR